MLSEVQAKLQKEMKKTMADMRAKFSEDHSIPRSKLIISTAHALALKSGSD